MRINNLKDYLDNHPRLKEALLKIFIAITYFLLARLGLFLATLNSNVSPVWPATGFAFAMLVMFGKRAWLSIFLGAFMANFFTPIPALAALFIAIGNTLEAYVGAACILWFNKYEARLSYQTETIAFVTAAAMGSIVSALIGTSTLYFFGTVTPESYLSVLLTWAIGDALGGLVVAPLILKLLRFKGDSSEISNWLGVLSFTLGVSYFVFASGHGNPYLFLIFPALLYASRTLEGFGVFIVSGLICVLSIIASLHEMGPFSYGSINERLVHLQLFLASIAITSLMLYGLGREKLTRFSSVVILILWMMAGSIFFSFERSESDRANEHFQALVKATERKINTTIASYESSLRSGAGLYAASETVSASEWRAYNRSLNISEHHPGMNGFGVIWPVKTDEIESFERDIRNEGIEGFTVKPVPGFSLQPLGSDRFNYVIKFIEPLEPNLAASGLDIGSEPNRRMAAETARDTGLATMTSKVILVQDQKKTPGFLYFFPIYSKDDSELHSDEERRAAHIGWVYSPFIYSNVFHEIFGTDKSEIEMQIFDGDSPDFENLLFSNFSGELKDYTVEESSSLSIGQRSFSLYWRRSPHFSPSHNTIVAWVGFCGAIASLLLLNLIIGLQILGERARELAADLTKELSASREKFREGERRLQYALDGAGDAVWDWNINGSEMYVNGKIAEVFEWPERFRVETVNDLRMTVHPDDLKTIGRSIAKLLRGESKVHEVETRYKTRSGDWRWVLTRGKISESDENNKPIRMTGVHIDIHEMKMIQQELESAKSQLKNIADSVPTLISKWDRNFNCRFANQAFRDWFGLSEDEILNMQLDDILTGHTDESLKDLHTRLRNGEKIRYERKVIRQTDGESRYVVATYLPDKNPANQGSFYIFAHDITELKKAELTAIEERKAALDANQVKSQFLANMSHEIRTPLNGILGITNLLKKTKLSDEQLDYLNVINQSSDTLLTIINDILDVSKIEAGRLELELLDFNLHDLIRDVCQSFQYSAQEKFINLKWSEDLGKHKHYKGDSSRIRQILINLIGNAIKFTSTGSVDVKVTASENRDASSSLHFEVTDTGIGIPDAAMKNMFQAFSQADVSMSRRYGGTGLGLSICRQLVEMMGGKIGVNSQEGKGSTFWFDLTLKHGETKSLKKNKKKMLPTPGLRILLAEDNRVNQQIALEILKSHGYEPHAVSDGIEVLAALRDSEYDIVLMDCQMPGMDGYEATRLIRAGEVVPKKNIPIIAITANALKGDKEKCLEAGMNDYVSKPIQEDLLIQTIESCLQKNIVDIKVIQELKKLQRPGQANLVENLIDLFFSSADDSMKKLKSAVKDKDYVLAESLAHSLKSSAANLGAMYFSTICLKLETASAQNAPPEKLNDLFNILNGEYAKVKSELLILKKTA